MVNINLKDFIKTGSFGGICLGMSDKEVRDKLGDPEYDSETPDVIMFAYGSWEVHFLKSNSNKAFLIYNDHLLFDHEEHANDIHFQNKIFKIDPDFVKVNAHTRLKEVEEILKKENVSYTINFKEFEPLLKTQSGVYMDFTDAEPTGARKDGVHFGPGINQKLEENEKKLTNQEDWILYTIGIYNMNTW